MIACFFQIPGSSDQVDEADNDDQGDARSHERARNGGASDSCSTRLPPLLSRAYFDEVVQISNSPLVSLLRT
jgi:hypothetical protein